MLKRPTRELKSFVQELAGGDVIPAFSTFSVFELRDAEPLFTEFCRYFSLIPCVFLRGHEELIEAEIRASTTGAQIDPVAFAPIGVRLPPGTDRAAKLKEMFEHDFVQQRELYWKTGRDEILASLVATAKDFPHLGVPLSPKEVRAFVDLATSQQLVYRKDRLQRAGVHYPHNIDLSRYPTLRAMALVMYYKFYENPRRKPKASDVFDFIISAPLPYVDRFITERALAESVRKARKVEPTLQHLEIQTIDALR